MDAVTAGKRLAGRQAADMVESGMTLGLGTGSTVYFALERLGERIRDEGLRVTGVPTSQQTVGLAEQFSIPLTDLARVSGLDLDIDGADQVNPFGDLIKGGGAALLREKIVAYHSRRFIVVVDEAKLADAVGFGRFPLPVEVIPFGWEATARRLTALGCTPVLRRKDGVPVRTDNGNYILDMPFGSMADPPALARELDGIPGVAEHGLFISMASLVLAGGAGGVRTIAPVQR